MGIVKINRISVDLVVLERYYSWRGCGVKVVLVQVRGKKGWGVLVPCVLTDDLFHSI